MPSPSAHKLAHALSTWIEVKLSGLSLLVAAVVGKVAVPSQVAQPWHISKAFYPIQKCSIAMCLVAVQPSLLPPMVVSVAHQARVSPVSTYAQNQDILQPSWSEMQIKLITYKLLTVQDIIIIKKVLLTSIRKRIVKAILFILIRQYIIAWMWRILRESRQW